MENYNINRNKEPLTESDIAKGQDFGAFMKAYSAAKPSFFKTPKFYALAAITGAIIIVGTWMMMKSDDQQVAEATPGFIQPLFAEAGDPDTNFIVDATKGGIFMNANGSMIQVPGSAFLDSAGNVVTGNVELYYREFHDVAKIFMAGIPMTYDSAGVQYHFESAGMIEITAWQNGKPLRTNPDSLIHVAMISNTAEERFNTYYLDTAAKQWKYVSDMRTQVFAPVKYDSAKLNPEPIVEAPPIAPRIAMKNAPSFAITFNPVEFPELVAYKGVRFEVDESLTPYNKEDKKVAWEDVTIRRVKNKDELRVKFTNGVREVEYVTHPVVDGKDYEAAKAEWEKRNAEYLKLKKQREEQEAKEAESQQALMEQRERHRVWINDSLANVMRDRRIAASLQSNTEDLIVREFTISDFGIWNADCPESLPSGMIVLANIADQDGKTIDLNQIYLVEKGRNALFMYMSYNFGQFGFNPEADNMIWAVTKDGRLATVSADDFKKATADGKKEVTFKFTVEANKVKDANEARRVLDIPPPVGM